MGTYKVTTEELKQVSNGIRNITGSTESLTWPDGYTNSLVQIKTNEDSVEATLKETISEITGEDLSNTDLKWPEGIQSALSGDGIDLDGDGETDIPSILDTIEDLNDKLSKFEVIEITTSPITTFSKLETTIETIESSYGSDSGYVLYIAKAIYDTDNCIVCFPIINGKYDVTGAYCYRAVLPDDADTVARFHFFSFSSGDNYKFNIPAGAQMLRWQLDYLGGAE